MANRDPHPAYLRLSCAVQTYAWGKVGMNSEVAKLKIGDPRYTVEEDQTYAELWMGTHSKGPSVISQPPNIAGQLLSDWIEYNQWALGGEVAAKFAGQLPFLFKVLSINKALSIQAHPTKSHAQVLHKSAPDKYPDPNHKPELVIVLKDFEGFCGFRPFKEIQAFMSSVPELEVLVGEATRAEMLQVSDQDSESDKRAILKKVFTAVMCCDGDTVQTQLNHLIQRAQDKTNAGLPEQESGLIVRLNAQFPGDIGCFCVFFLNFLKLGPGESLFLAPNEPHAYIFGEVVECMACSDNVVRAGLTPKFRDKDTLCEMLTYCTRTPQESKFLPQLHPQNPLIGVYDPPTPEFTVARITIPAETESFELPPINGPSVLIVLSGSLEAECKGLTEQMNKGTVIFLPAGREVKLRPLEAHESLVFQAYCNA